LAARPTPFRPVSRDELGQCRWLCVDADSPEGVDQLHLVQHTLEAHGLSSLLECSRRGGHLWLFFSLPQSAALATAVVEGLLDPLYVSGQLPQVLEVYPDHTELGHAVRIPLGIHRRTGQRYPFLDTEGTPINLEDLSAAMAFVLAQPAIRPERLRAVAAHLGVSSQLSRTSPAASQPSVLASSSTTSAVIRWVDAQVNPLDLCEELAPATDMRLEILGRLASMSSITAAMAGAGAASRPTAFTAMGLCATASACFRSCSSSMW